MSTIITGSASLREFNVNWNPNIGDDGMSLISSEDSKILTKLGVASCGLSVKGSWCIQHRLPCG